MRGQGPPALVLWVTRPEGGGLGPWVRWQEGGHIFMLIKASTSSGAHLDGSEPWLGPLGGVWWSHLLKATRPGPRLREMLQAQAPFMATPGSGQGQGPGPHEAGAASSRAGQVGPGQPLPGQLGGRLALALGEPAVVPCTPLPVSLCFSLFLAFMLSITPHMKSPVILLLSLPESHFCLSFHN